MTVPAVVKRLASMCLSLILAGGLLSPAAQAAPLCRTVAEHQVCVVKITRSAKYYWEYRAVVEVDAQRRPMGRYNCRTRTYTSHKGEQIANDVATQVICSFFKQ